MTLVYLDTETTGLDPNHHHIWEMAYAIDDGPIESAIVPHTIAGADDKALEIGRYFERTALRHVSTQFEMGMMSDLEGATLVGANPAFDTAFLRARWGITPWRYRLLDIEAYAMGALGWDEPKGLAAIAETLVIGEGYEIPAPDHTAAGDVDTLRDCHWALREIYRGER